MTSGQKTAASLLTTVILFAVFAVLAFAGLFSVIDARFYEPAKVMQIKSSLDSISESYDEYLTALSERFENSFLNQSAVKTFAERSPSDSSVQERTRLAGDLFSSTQGLSGIRLVDRNENSIFYSSFRSDVLRQTDKFVSYKNYSETVTPSGLKEIPFDKVSASEGAKCLYFDGRDSRIIFSYPFYDTYSTLRGTMLFYVNAQDFNRFLIKKKLITFSGTGSLISPENISQDDDSYAELVEKNVHGFAFGIPFVARELFEKQILLRQCEGASESERLVEMSNADEFWVMISGEKSLGGFVSGIYDEELFSLPKSVRILILVCAFVSLFLVVFMLFNLKQDDMTVIRRRIKALQIGVVNEYLNTKEDVDWKEISRKISLRRGDITGEIMKSLGRRGKKHSKEASELIDRSWNEMISAMSSGIGSSSVEGTVEIKKLLEEILSNGHIQISAAPASVTQSSVNEEKKAEPVHQEIPHSDMFRSHEEIESPAELEEAEPLEEVSEAEPIEDAEPVEEAEAVEEAESVEELEEIPEAESIDEAEPVEDAEPVEESEDVDEAESVEEAEELESIDEPELLEPLEPLESVESGAGEKSSSSSAIVKSENDDGSNSNKNTSDENIPVKKSLLARAVEINRKSAEEDFIHAENFDFSEPERKVYSNEEDNYIINNFEVSSGLDFSNLDEESKDIQENGTVNLGAIKTEDVPVDHFGFKNPELAEFKEEIGFSSPRPETGNADALSDELDFVTYPKPENFSGLDKTFANKKEKLDVQTLRENDLKALRNNLQGAEMVEETNAAGNGEFMFTPFAADNGEVMELDYSESEDAILEDGDGVFYINNILPTSDVKQDAAFKDLVDSVLHA